MNINCVIEYFVYAYDCWSTQMRTIFLHIALHRNEEKTGAARQAVLDKCYVVHVDLTGAIKWAGLEQFGMGWKMMRGIDTYTRYQNNIRSHGVIAECKLYM